MEEAKHVSLKGSVAAKSAATAVSPPLTVTEANERGGIPDGHRWEPDYDAPIAKDGQRPGRIVPITEEHVEALRRQEERRRMLADAPKGPRLVRAVRAVRAVVAPRRANGSSGRPKASSARSSSRSGDSGDDGEDGPGDAGRVVARIRAWWRAIRDAWAMRGHADLDEQLDDALARDAWAAGPAEWWSLDSRGVTELYDDEPA